MSVMRINLKGGTKVIKKYAKIRSGVAVRVNLWFTMSQTHVLGRTRARVGGQY